jgi:nucleoside-diphosphate-sugar epimerase
MGEASEICVVTGGRGFLAKCVVQKLLEEGRFVVRIVDLAPNISLTTEEFTGELGHGLETGRVQYAQCDIRDKKQVVEVMRGVAVVFHMAAPDTSNNSFKLHFDVSVTGTRNVIEACLACGVKKLIYTSSPSIVFDGVHPVINVDESAPICDKFNDYYSDAKAHGEALVLSSNGKNGLLTCAIRPSGIFGPGDKLTVPAFAKSARAGKLKFILGDGKNMFDWTYVENVAHAHVCAERALVPGEFVGENVASGKAFFITNQEPIPFWEFLTKIITGLGYPKPKANIPAPLVLTIAEAYDSLAKALAPLGVKPAVNFNPVRLRLVTVTRTFNCDRAKTLLGYKPIVSLEEGIRRTVEAFPELRADAPDLDTADREIQPSSNIHGALGGGAVANLLLWKDSKRTAALFFTLLAILYFFYSSGTTLVSALSYNLCVVLIAVFVLNFLPDPIFQISLPKIPPSLFEISEESVNVVALELQSYWNSGVSLLERIVVHRDFSLFFKVMAVLRVMKFFGRFSFQSLLFMGLFAAFSAPYLYEQNEEEFDKLRALAFETFHSYSGLVASKLPENIRGRLEMKKMQ